MKKLIVVDVSNFIFRAFFAIRSLNAPDGTPVNAVYGVLNMFLKLFSEHRPTHLLMAKDTSGGSFRNKLYSEYKANRSEPPEDLIPQFALIQELIEKMNVKFALDNNYEADDIIGSSVTQWKDDFDEILIASGDKDLMQFIDGNIKMLDTMKGKTYDEKGVFEKMGVRPDQIVDYLSMVGDSSDNIPGMKGIGAKGAAKLLAEYDTLENCIAHKDEMKGKKLINAFENHLDDAKLSKELIKIVQDIDLGVKAEETSYHFYPSDDLVEFLKGLGFKGVIQKLEDIKRNEARVEESDGEESFQGIQPTSKFKTSIIQTEAEIENIFELVQSTSAISLHSEYNSGDIFERKIDSVTLSVDGENAYFISFGEDSAFKPAHLKKLFELTWGSNNLEIISEHWKRDLFFARENNFEQKCLRFDLTQAHYILYAGGKHELPFVVKDYLDFDLIARDKKDPFLTGLSVEEKSQFCGERASAGFKVAELLKRELQEKNLEKIYYEIDDVLSPILSAVEGQGVKVNIGFFKELEEEYQKKLNEIEEKISALYEGDPINLNSPKQVGELLFTTLELPVIKKTKTGYSTDSEVLETLDGKGLSPVPGLILQYRELSKLLSTYVKTLPLLVHPKSGRIHTHFNQHVAATGRLSSNNPNLQNIPTRTELGRRIRRGFVAKEGHVFLGADYSQVELRLLAHFSNDSTMVKAFLEDKDIHRQTASEVLGVELAKVTSEERSKAKAVNFGLMYGQSSFGLASQLRISRSEAKDYITKYFQRFSQVKGYLDGLKELAEKNGYAETFHGRKRYLPDIHSKNRTIKAMAERVAINSPIQGTAADIIKLAMISIDKTIDLKGLQSKMILQVHDELIFEVPEKELDEMRVIIRDGMENVVKLSIPLKVDVGTADNWYDLK
jgi:DNA polymerase I